MRKELLSISQYLDRHPILAEKPDLKLNYLNVLEYFVKRFSQNNIFAIEMFEIYKQKFLGSIYYFNANNVKQSAKKVSSLKIRNGRIKNYKYILWFDCFFINSFNDFNSGFTIKEGLKWICDRRHHKKIDRLFATLYGINYQKSFPELEIPLQCWQKNKTYFEKPIRKILITANMSAGKSTLINALVGKKVNKTQNEACTAKIHYVFNKPYEDGYSYEWDYDLNLNADLQTLMQDNPDNTDLEICVGTYFRTSIKPTERICIIDTPGVNSSCDKSHKELTYKFIDINSFNIIVCVLNASNIGTNDDLNHLRHLSNIKNKQIIFVINQIDKFNKDEDSIDECIKKVKKDIQEIGFDNAVVCPVSAYAGLLAKKYLYQEKMTEVEMLELQMYILKFQENFNVMQKFFTPDNSIAANMTLRDDLSKKCFLLLQQSGLNNLENILFNTQEEQIK